ncbi:MAG: C25 family cysteine peptidase [Candidatus Thermoplasmatota archaeon]|nr:C25 family cysteine peptidase [Candidatus Thermoplasmatota archaeon]
MAVKTEKTKVAVMLVVAILLFSSGGIAGVYNAGKAGVGNVNVITEISLSFSRPTVSSNENYVAVNVKEANSTLVASEPILPVHSTVLTFPLGTKILGVECIPLAIRTMKLDKKIEPAPEPILLDGKYSPKKVVENEGVYGSTAPYPERWCYYRTGGGIDNGERVTFLSVSVYPVRYLPALNILQYATNIKIKISYEESIQPLFADAYDLLIVSPSEFSDALQPLIEHKESYDVKTMLVSLDEIYNSNYFTVRGRDDAEKIKYFIKNAVEEWGIDYVMLVGNSEKLPVRRAYVKDGEESSYISDLYYADIYDSDGNFVSWDSNGNDKFGEYDENEIDFVDLYPDVFIGRAACSTNEEVTVVVNKIISHENMEAYEKPWFKNIIVCGGDTFPGDDDNIDEGEYANQKVLDIMGNFNPTKLWASNNKIDSPANIDHALYEGAGFIDFSGHGSPGSWVTHPHGKDKVWLPYGGYKIRNINSLVNGDKLPIVILNVCSNCKFSMNCFGWAFLSNPDGGGIAVCGNTGLGWGYDGRSTVQRLCGLMELNSFRSYAGGAETFGEIWKETINKYVNRFGSSMDKLDYKTVEEWEPLGDPSLQVAIQSPDENKPPNKPEKPTGPTSGKRWKEYGYTTSSVDPDGDQIYYMFDWGDGTNTGWIGPYDSGGEVNASHTWDKRGNYEIKVKAMDLYGAESAWSDPLEVSTPLYYPKLFQLLFERLNEFLSLLMENNILWTSS